MFHKLALIIALALGLSAVPAMQAAERGGHGYGYGNRGYSGHGYSGRSYVYRGGHVDRDFRGYRGAPYYRGGYGYGLGLSDGYGYAPGYYPAPSCGGYYDAWGYWHANPCYAPYSYGYPY
jgi:hypothetical protein